MSTGIIVAIVVVAVIVVALLLLATTRMRRAAGERRRERELTQRREQAATGHRRAADARLGRAQEAEHRARLAGAVAERERADAQLHEERARANEMGLNDNELIGEERVAEGREPVAPAGNRVRDYGDAEARVGRERKPG
jgi:FtsZ-interacting cell division protein ZipA